MVMAGAEAVPYFWLQPAVTGVAALLVLTGAGITVRPRYVADRRDQWWKRTQWALELVLSGEEDAAVPGLQVLPQQAAAKTAHVEDARFITQVLQPLVDRYGTKPDTRNSTAVESGVSETYTRRKETDD